mgnify:CR=1 FL=1
MRIPFSAPSFAPTNDAIGVANPKEQGHDMTKTEIAKLNAKDISLGGIEAQTTKMIMLKIITTGTKYSAHRAAY